MTNCKMQKLNASEPQIIYEKENDLLNQKIFN